MDKPKDLKNPPVIGKIVDESTLPPYTSGTLSVVVPYNPWNLRAQEYELGPQPQFDEIVPTAKELRCQVPSDVDNEEHDLESTIA